MEQPWWIKKQVSKWMVKLDGSERSLNTLKNIRFPKNIQIKEFHGELYIRSEDFDELIHPNLVYDHAAKLIPVINGLVKLHSRNYKNVSLRYYILGFDPEGIPAAALQIICQAEFDIVPLPELSKELEEKGIDLTPDISTHVLLALKDDNIEKALRIFSQAHTWENLYKLFEIIRADAGRRIYSQGWCKESDMKLFTQTANSPKAIGDAARHGHEKTDPPKKPMQINTSVVVINNLFNKWLEWKLN